LARAFFAYLSSPVSTDNTEVLLRDASSSKLKHPPAQEVELPTIKGASLKKMNDQTSKEAATTTANKSATAAQTEKDKDPFSKEYDNCIVGAGLSGSVIAENYATKLGQTSLIIEKRDHIGSNCYDYIDDETGIRVSLFGAHLFHTRHTRVWDYVQKFSQWVPYEHKVLGIVNGKHVPIPVTIDTVNTLFDEAVGYFEL